ncbi:hypothetical protein CDV31_017064 [Fusarium ambrosium]|uniref:Uncharacterized protein n=1 Tax=Fusarium ambrosium TaxID=131363 RepID=A0A428RU53_9HYPO|nr:hypothetical protein CDV31_017064 [Fusarium ambrosium]
MSASERISWRPSSSENNEGLETAIKGIAKLAFGEQIEYYIACTETPNTFRASLSAIGHSGDFVNVEADSEIQSLFQVGIEVCQHGIDSPHDGLSLEDIMDYESDLAECAKTVYMTPGPFSLNIDRPSPLTIAGASLLDGGKVIIEAKSDDKKKCLFMLFKGLFEEVEMDHRAIEA